MKQELQFYKDEQFQRQLNALAAIILPEIRRFYESKEGQQAFEAWKAEHPQKEST